MLRFAKYRIFRHSFRRTLTAPGCAMDANILSDTEEVTLANGKRVRVDKLGYRANVAMVLFNDDGKVFTCKRPAATSNIGSENWQYPQGGIDESEEPLAAALRELEEETSIPRSCISLVAEHPGWLQYDFDLETLQRLGPRMSAYRGQKQKYFLARFTGDDSQVSFDVAGHKPEFEAFEWVAIEDTVARVATFKRPVYTSVAQEFGPIIAREVASRGNGAGDSA